MSIGWWDILKVEDIAFEEIFDAQGRPKTGRFRVGHFGNEQSIRVNPKEITRRLKKKLGREPTEEEISQAVSRIVMHEAGHAAHFDADRRSFADRDKYDAEYVAFINQFPESLYLALKNLVEHPDARERKETNSMLENILKVTVLKDRAKTIKGILSWVDIHAKKSSDKEKLIRLEMAPRKALSRFSKDKLPFTLEQATARYGVENRKFLNTLKW